MIVDYVQITCALPSIIARLGGHYISKLEPRSQSIFCSNLALLPQDLVRVPRYIAHAAPQPGRYAELYDRFSGPKVNRKQ